MKIKAITLLALMLVMGAFLFPVSAHASENVAPPSVNASISGTMLRIETQDGFYPVEAIFINEQRFNYRVDGVLEVDIRDYIGDGGRFSVYAIDFAGNKSNVVWLDNPAAAPSIPAEPPQPPRQANPFTPDGQASVLDNAAEADGKEFFTFTTPDGNTFHLIIDRERNSDNVYFLNAVTESDLIALAEKSGNTISTGSSGIPTPPPEEPPAETENPPEPETPPEKKSNSGTLIFVIIGALAVGGAGYYFKIVKPKQQGPDSYDDEDDDGGGDNDTDDTDEMEFEDEKPEQDEDVQAELSGDGQSNDENDSDSQEDDEDE